jgi:hypothetical protein
VIVDLGHVEIGIPEELYCCDCIFNFKRSGTPGIFSIWETFKRHKRQTATGRDKCTLLIKKSLLGVIAHIHNDGILCAINEVEQAALLSVSRPPRHHEVAFWH